MNFELIFTRDFRKSIKGLSKRYKSLRQDFEAFVKSIQDNPFQGDELRPGIRKIRMSITSKGKGKSGGARVITYTVIASEIEGKIYFLDIYDKSDFSTVDVNILQSIVSNIEE